VTIPSAARGLEPGLQTVLLTDTVEIGDHDMVFNIGVIPPKDHFDPSVPLGKLPPESPLERVTGTPPSLLHESFTDHVTGHAGYSDWFLQ
jgi:hypothetical protein